MNKPDIIIVGSGLGGLLCGYLLSREGFHVFILEKHSVTGGCLQTFRRFGHSFDTGVHYIGGMAPGQALHRYWKYFGLSGSLDLRPMDRDCFDLVAFPDAEFPLAQGTENFTNRLRPLLPGREKALDDYIALLEEVTRTFPLYNLELPGEHREDHYKTGKAFEVLARLDAGGTSAAAGCHTLQDVAGGNNFLYCGDRESTPLHQHALISHSFISGAARLNGGSRQIAEKLEKGILAMGGTILTRQEVTSISRLQEKYLVTTSGGENFVAPMVISSIHPAVTLRLLHPDLTRKAYRTRISSLPDTPASFGLHLALKPGTVPFLNHNIHYHASNDTWNESGVTGDAWPVQYMLSTPPEPQQGPFAETMVILAYMQAGEVAEWENTLTGRRPEAYKAFKTERADRLLSLVEKRFPGLKANIAGMEVSTPLTWRDYTGTPGGSMYGIAKSPGSHPENVIQPRTRMTNFYLTGQSTNLHGLQGVTIGAVLTCSEILGLEYTLNKIRDAAGE